MHILMRNSTLKLCHGVNLFWEVHYRILKFVINFCIIKHVNARFLYAMHISLLP